MMTKKTLITGFVLMVISGSICLLAAEIAWRIYSNTGNPSMVWHPDFYLTEEPSAEWQYRTPEFNALVRTNSLGFRGPEFPKEKPRGIQRIVFLGDSFVASKQVEEEERFVDKVGDALNVETVGLGIDAADLLREIQYWRFIGKGLQPDLVVHSFYGINDLVTDPSYFTFYEESGKEFVSDVHMPDQTEAPKKKIHSKFLSSLWAFVQRRIRNKTTDTDGETREEILGSFARLTTFGQESFEKMNVWENTMSVLRTIQKDVTSTGAKYVLLLIPSSMEVQTSWQKEAMDSYSFVQEDEWNIKGFHERLKQELRENGIPFIDVREEFQERIANGSTLYYKIDPHFNEEGHQIVTEVLAQELESFLPKQDE